MFHHISLRLNQKVWKKDICSEQHEICKSNKENVLRPATVLLVEWSYPSRWHVWAPDGRSSTSETISKYFLWTTITKSPFSGKGSRIPAGVCVLLYYFFKFRRQKEADPIPRILQDTDLHFLCTLMKQQLSCLPPLTAPLILHCALTTVCVGGCPSAWCVSVGRCNKYVWVGMPLMYVLGYGCLYCFIARSYHSQESLCLFLENLHSLTFVGTNTIYVRL